MEMSDKDLSSPCQAASFSVTDKLRRQRLGNSTGPAAAVVVCCDSQNASVRYSIDTQTQERVHTRTRTRTQSGRTIND